MHLPNIAKYCQITPISADFCQVAEKPQNSSFFNENYFLRTKIGQFQKNILPLCLE